MSASQATCSQAMSSQAMSSQATSSQAAPCQTTSSQLKLAEQAGPAEQETTPTTWPAWLHDTYSTDGGDVWTLEEFNDYVYNKWDWKVTEARMRKDDARRMAEHRARWAEEAQAAREQSDLNSNSKKLNPDKAG